jgi:tripartite-type tricarboxylate transporter receptor subunit TctC
VAGHRETLPGYESSAWFGLFGPARMAPDLASASATQRARPFATPEVRRRLEGDAAHPGGQQPGGLCSLRAGEIPRWAELVRYAGATPD